MLSEGISLTYVETMVSGDLEHRTMVGPLRGSIPLVLSMGLRKRPSLRSDMLKFFTDDERESQAWSPDETGRMRQV
jgi:hypothetical protein